MMYKTCTEVFYYFYYFATCDASLANFLFFGITRILGGNAANPSSKGKI